jgi:hypothetical protein
MPTEAELHDFYPPAPRVLYHYTDKAGYEGISKTRTIFASTIPGNKTTHYGKGVYFTTLGPEAIKSKGVHKVIELVFNKINHYSIDKMSYYFEVEVDPKWYPIVALDPFTHKPVNHIWIVADPDHAYEKAEAKGSKVSISIDGLIVPDHHGITKIGTMADELKRAYGVYGEPEFSGPYLGSK